MVWRPPWPHDFVPQPASALGMKATKQQPAEAMISSDRTSENTAAPPLARGLTHDPCPWRSGATPGKYVVERIFGAGQVPGGRATPTIPGEQRGRGRATRWGRCPAQRRAWAGQRPQVAPDGAQKKMGLHPRSVGVSSTGGGGARWTRHGVTATPDRHLRSRLPPAPQARSPNGAEGHGLWVWGQPVAVTDLALTGNSAEVRRRPNRSRAARRARR